MRADQNRQDHNRVADHIEVNRAEVQLLQTSVMHGENGEIVPNTLLEFRLQGMEVGGSVGAEVIDVLRPAEAVEEWRRWRRRTLRSSPTTAWLMS